jgi:hypothetical protein
MNDKGPAKAIGAMVGFALLAPRQKTVRIREATSVTMLQVEKLAKRLKAATSAIDLEGPLGLF